jgi:plasmid maintenance system antidote protein VapI
MPMKNPPHPGDFIWTEIIEPAGLTVTAAAALHVSRPALRDGHQHRRLQRHDFSGRDQGNGIQLDLRIEKAFGVKMDTLMRMQAS